MDEKRVEWDSKRSGLRDGGEALPLKEAEINPPSPGHFDSGVRKNPKVSLIRGRNGYFRNKSIRRPFKTGLLGQLSMKRRSSQIDPPPSLSKFHPHAPSFPPDL